MLVDISFGFIGEAEHRDSTGATGVLSAGDVQWMTAGSGVIHAEYLSEAFTKRGGVLEMAQLWVNLPTKHKMTKPRYQDIKSKDIPVFSFPDGAGSMRIIAGKYEDSVGPAKTFSPVHVYDITLTPNKPVNIDIDDKFSSMIFIRRGSIQFGETKQTLKEGQMAILSDVGSRALLEGISSTDSSVLLLSGEPLNEPIAHHGPFVMNTREELVQAFNEFQNGNFIRKV